MNIIIALGLGISLSAACGFRVFIPPLVISVAANLGHLSLSPDFAWMGTESALVALAIATTVEILAYYIPFLDNLLDSLAAPAAIAAGTVVTASTLTEIDPVVQWTLAAIAGGGAAGIIEGLTSITRLTSTGLTGGLGNPILSTIELLTSLLLTIFALTLPIISAIVVLGLLGFGIQKIVRYWNKRRKRSNSS